MNTIDIEYQAKLELQEETNRAAVEAAKGRLRAKQGRPWWKRLFPYRIKLERL